MSTAIRPFTFDVAAADLDDLQSRLVHTRWPERETSTDWSQGIPLAYTQEVCAYWRERYDWRRCEAQLNAYPQGSCWIPGSYTPCTGLKRLILNGFFQRCRIGHDQRVKPVKTICYAKLDQLRPWNPI
jgi:hypothetical protein